MRSYFSVRVPYTQGGSYGNKILYKNLDLTQDFPNKISFHFLWVKMLPKNLPKIFRWPRFSNGSLHENLRAARQISCAASLHVLCVFSSHPFWTSSSLDVPAGVTQEEGHTRFLIHLPSAVLHVLEV